MPKKFKILAIFILSISLTSCIELVEEIKINPDLSGNYHLYLKHNGLDILFSSITKNLDLSKIKNGIQELEKQKGISNLKSVIDLKKGKFSVRFDFSDAKSLTQAFYASIGAKKRFYHKNFLRVNQSKIKRPNLTPYLVKYFEKNGLLDQLPSTEILDYVDYRYRVISTKVIKTALPSSTSINQYEYSRLYPMNTLLLQGQSIKSVIRLNK